MIECPGCAGRGCVDGEEEPELCVTCKGKGKIRAGRGAHGWDPAPVGRVSMGRDKDGTERWIEFEAPPCRKIDPSSFTEAEIAEIEHRHGWSVKRP
jgi:DnaJ-class molecular chaperone